MFQYSVPRYATDIVKYKEKRTSKKHAFVEKKIAADRMLSYISIIQSE